MSTASPVREVTIGNEKVQLRDGTRADIAGIDPDTWKKIDTYARQLEAQPRPFDPALKHYGVDSRRMTPAQPHKARVWLKRVGMWLAIFMSGGAQGNVRLFVVSPGSTAYTTEGVAAWSAPTNRGEI